MNSFKSVFSKVMLMWSLRGSSEGCISLSSSTANVPSKLYAQVVRRAHTRKFGAHNKISFPKTFFAHILCRSSHIQTSPGKCFTKEILCAHILYKIRGNIVHGSCTEKARSSTHVAGGSVSQDSGSIDCTFS